MDGEEMLMELDPNTDIGCVAEMHQILAAALDQSLPIVIDASGVERMDTAGVQLLYSFATQAMGQSRVVSFRDVSEGMSDAFRVAGLGDWLAGQGA